MSSTIECTHCQYPSAVKDEKTNVIFCPSCGLFVDPFYSWKKTDIHTIVIPAQTCLWIPIVFSASLKDEPVTAWVLAKHQTVDPENKWGEALHGYLARRACDADRNRILHKKIYDAIITGQAEDLIGASVEVRLIRDLNMLIDLTGVKIGLIQAIQKYDGVIRRTDFQGKGAAAIHVFDPRLLTMNKYEAKPPVSPKQAVDDQAFMKSLKATW
jgi:hypothetical protein